MCNCHSYNMDNGETPNAILKPPVEFGLTYPDGEVVTTICIDACISHVIKHLWINGIKTINSCCGHNERIPSIILECESTYCFARKVKDIINQVDNRDFDVLSWVDGCLTKL